MAEPPSWTSPSLSLAVPPILLTVQSTLCQYPQSTSLRVIRLLLLPICLYGTWTCMDTYFEPARDFVIFNIIIHITRAWACFRSVELATASEQYRWIGYAAAYDSSKPEEGPQIFRPSPGQAVLNGWANLCSLRGIGWSWGIKANQVPPSHPPASPLPSMLRLQALSQALSAGGLAVIILFRRAGSPANHIASITGLEQSDALEALAKTINVGLVGLVIFSSIETGYAALSLAVWLLSSLLRATLPAYLAPRSFDVRGWPRLMQHPQRSTSLHEFWGKRWHALFKRIFVHDGSKTLSRAVTMVGGGKLLSSAAAVTGAFIVSGWMHESFNYATPWAPRDPNYDTFRFFAIQPLGIIAESAFTKTTGKRVGGLLGFLWTFGFLLFTGNLMADCWIARGAVDYAPHPSTWEWWRWVLPFGYVFPRLTP